MASPAASVGPRPSPRRQAVTELGNAAFRAAQLSRQVVVRHVDSVDECTDLGDADRERLAPLLPTLLTASKVQTCDGDATRKTLWKLHDGALVRIGSHALPEAGHAVPVIAGGLRYGMSVLRDGSGRIAAQLECG